ncbi:hypothetical protein [Gilvibacter sediminis]|uniref:hypothetical protein n=1 Tax=Gilvibacter sediminis TaxID=379071 RepID=UPI00234FF43C|nr:hypothetical protein [Gilvibacter sediminis]MDC7997752.1 hypothetical protein [Gilvibacter sediminis]
MTDIIPMTLNRVALTFGLLLTLGSCKDTPMTCEDFHEGVFEIVKPEDDYAVRIERKGDQQIETNIKTGAVTKATVTWDNICNYQLTYTESTSEHAVNLIGKVLIVRITGIQGNKYSYEAVLRGTQTVTSGFITAVD